MINQHQRSFKEQMINARGEISKRPDWLKVRLPGGANYADVKNLMRTQRLNTVCEEAKCPNIGECWNRRTATFIILGDTCTRSCGFCNIKVGLPSALDLDEPRRVAESVEQLKLKHVVITSVNRDELKHGGAEIFADTIRRIRETSPHCSIEILIPDFKGDKTAFEIILADPPDILNHNLETVKSLYHAVRPQAKYERSLDLITWFKSKGLRTKSGIMLGIGEKDEEVYTLLNDLQKAGCDILTIGQYLQPTKNHLPVIRYVPMETFQAFKEFGLQIGFEVVESSPLVRSSYHADEQAKKII
jgi:lipoic acid synthetase